MTDRLCLALYVSESRIGADARREEVERIAWTSAARNMDLCVTGALLFTGTHFAQAIEGDAAAIDALLERIKADGRHDRIKLLVEKPVRFRRFHGWSMAYPGATPFLSSVILRLHGYETIRSDADRLLAIMEAVIADGATGTARRTL